MYTVIQFTFQATSNIPKDYVRFNIIYAFLKYIKVKILYRNAKS